jgi:hypothetical protein
LREVQIVGSMQARDCEVVCKTNSHCVR